LYTGFATPGYNGGIALKSALFDLRLYNRTGPRDDFVHNEATVPEYVLLAAETGGFEFDIGQHAGYASFGDVVIARPDTLFKRKATGEITYHVFYFKPEPSVGDIPSGKISLSDVHRLSSTYAYLRNIYNEHKYDCASQLLTHHLLSDLLHMCGLETRSIERRKRASDPIIQKAAGLIHHHLFDDTNMKTIADEVNMKPSEMTRRFRVVFGITPVEYAIRLRLNEVKRLLCETNDTLETIAANCGYVNGSYLSRIFHSKVGLTPSAFRNKHQV
jgi:AraC-like DNA-binding protein